MSEQLELTIVLPASPQRVYTAWLDGADHGRFTGSAAEIDPRVGGRFTAWDGYISGETLALEPYTRILQSWRTDEFPAEAPDSRLELLLESQGDATRLTLRHTLIPDGQAGQYEQGWRDYYFQTMLEFFSV
jgi:uncharacterized protein YndB with AHSA1/START domain